jgi:predicted nucleic acid-binding protein
VSVGTLVDANILLDVLTEDRRWLPWSMSALEVAAETGPLMINQVVYGEVSIRFSRIEDLDDALPPEDYRRVPMPWEAAFLAGKAYVRYRRSGGQRRSTLPDFFIGAHAAVDDLQLLTRDAARYRTYFPTVTLVAPSE